MQSIEIDPELNRPALAEAAQQYPEFADHALRVVARPLSRGFAWQLEWKGALESMPVAEGLPPCLSRDDTVKQACQVGMARRQIATAGTHRKQSAPVIAESHQDAPVLEVDRYGNGSALGVVQARARWQWACAPQSAMLRYFLRVAPLYVRRQGCGDTRQRFGRERWIIS